jgi:hypothetical protein
MNILNRLNTIAARTEKYNDKEIAKKLILVAKNNPSTRIKTDKNFEIEVRREVTASGKVEYTAFVDGVEDRVAWVYPGGVTGGRIQVTNANVYIINGVNYRRLGIASTIYNLIETDLKEAGGDKVEPQFGSMSEDAKAFWKKRRPEYAKEIDRWNEIGYSASGLFD